MMRCVATAAISLLVGTCPQGRTWAVDVVEFLNGATVSGSVTSIRKEQKEFDFEATVGSRKVVQTYGFSKVHAVTMDGKRHVLTPVSVAQTQRIDAQGNPIRTAAEIDQLIQAVGSSAPDWFDQTPLVYPDTLDLAWPLKPEGKWNNKKNMGQYIWDIINPNPPKWRGGIKLVQHCLGLHQGDIQRVRRDQGTIARMYFDLMQDYPRAAYWLRKAGAKKGERQGVMLAECYYRMGNRALAKKTLDSNRYNAGAAAMAVKLYGNMGELDEALKMAERIANTANAYMGFVAAGDALREAGKYDAAIQWYSRVLSDGKFRNEQYERRYKARARESIEAIELFEQVDVSAIPDGTYSGSSTGYNGRLDVEVLMRDGKIRAVTVSQHREKQFYSAFTDTEASIVKLQSVRGVDGTSGATITSRAIVNATAKALAGGSP